MRLFYVYDTNTFEHLYECYSSRDLDEWIKNHSAYLVGRDWAYTSDFDFWFD